MSRMIHTTQGPVQANIIIPGSKNITYRALLLAALADGVSEIFDILINNETKIFIEALRQVGIVVQLDEKSRSCIIAGCNGQYPKKQATLWCANTASIARFLLTSCALVQGVYYFDGGKHLREITLRHLLQTLNQQGVQIIPNSQHLPFTLVGVDSIKGGDIIFDVAINSQVISALLMISPYTRTSFNFSIPESIHQHYIDMTCSMMAEFGVLVHRIRQGQFSVPVPQRYQARDYKVEPDFSLALYFFAAAAVTNGEITIQPTKQSSSKQANASFLSLLKKMGCRIIETSTGLRVKGPTKLKGIEVSLRKVSDSFLALSAIAPFANTPTRITHIGNMDSKEKERLQLLKNELLKLNIQIEAGDNWLKIFPSMPQSTILNAHHDHRMAMALSLIGLKVPGVSIENTNCIEALYPDFFNVWDQLAEPLDVKV